MKAGFQIPGALRCPIEIYSIIFQHLSAKDFYSLFWVCKFLKELAEPFLYSDIQLNWRKHARPPRIFSLIRNILSRPDLAVFITSLTLGKRGAESMRSIATTRDVRLTVDEIDIEQSIKVIETFNIEYGDLWIRQLRNRNMDAFVAILLYESEIIGLVLRSTLLPASNCKIASFKQLRYVAFNQSSVGRFRRRTWNTQDILPLFCFPNIVCLSATIDTPVSFGWPPGSTSPVASNLTALDLDMAKENILCHILLVTTGLKALRWRWHTYQNDRTTIQYDVIIRALSHVRNTLTNLLISAENEVVNTHSSWIGVTGSLGGLVNFNFLKTFEIKLEFLLGSISSPQDRLRYSPHSGRILQFERIVPKNIEVLTLTDGKELEWQNHVHYPMVVKAIQSWLGTWEISTPHLRSIRFLLIYDYQEFDSAPSRDPFKLDRTMRTHLDRLSVTAGVQIEVRQIYRTNL